jgi:O-antigen ligase
VLTAYNFNYALAELGFIFLAMPISIFAFAQSGKKFEISTLSTFLWSVAILMLVLPHLLKAPHFHGSAYHFFANTSLVSAFFLITLAVHRYGPVFSNAFFYINVEITFIYCIIFWILFSLGVYTAPNENYTSYTFPGFQNIRHMVYLIGPASVIALLLGTNLNFEPKRALFWTFALGLPVLWSLLMWSGSRAGVLSVLVSLIVTISFAKHNRSKLILLMAVLIPVSILLSFTYPTPGPGLGFWRLFNTPSGSLSMNAISNSRIELWLLAIKDIQAHPILGYGMSGFTHSIRTYTDMPVVQAHNGYLEYIHAGGVIAGLCIFGSIGAFYVQLVRAVRQSTDIILIATFAAITATLIYAMLDGVFYHYRPLFQTAILFAFANYHLQIAQGKIKNHA